MFTCVRNKAFSAIRAARLLISFALVGRGEGEGHQNEFAFHTIANPNGTWNVNLPVKQSLLPGKNANALDFVYGGAHEARLELPVKGPDDMSVVSNVTIEYWL